MKVLLIKTSSMGDIVHTLPAVSDAMIQYPDIQFDWVVEDKFADIPSWHSAVKQVILVAIRRWRKNWLAKSARQEINKFLSILRNKKYTAIIDAQGLLKSACLVMSVTSFSSGKRHGYNWKSAREPLASLFYDDCYGVKKQQHAIERIRELFAHSLHYIKPHTAGDYGIGKFFSTSNLVKPISPYIIFFHATSPSRKNKQWPLSYWRELISIINIQVQAQGLTVKLPWATNLEYLRAMKIATGFNNVEILPQLSLTKLAQQILAAKAVVSVDTGLSHVTAALGKYNITLYGPTDPMLIGCYGDKQQAIVSVDGNMESIKPYEVYKKLSSNIKNIN